MPDKPLSQEEKRKKAHAALLAVQAGMRKSRGVTGPSRKALGVKKTTKKKVVKKKKEEGTFAWLKRQLGMGSKKTARTKDVEKQASRAGLTKQEIARFSPKKKK